MPYFGNEIGIWCPSDDSSGDGTSDLNDLSGGSWDLTLSGNMTPASDWKTETSNNGSRVIETTHSDFNALASTDWVREKNSGITIPTYGGTGKTELTIGGWFKIGSYHDSSYSQGLLSVWEDFYETDFLLYITPVGEFRFSIYAEAETVRYNVKPGTTTPSFGTGTWYHIVCVYDAASSNTVKIYIDGTEEGSNAVTSGDEVSQGSGTSRLTIHAYNLATQISSVKQNHGGSFDDIRVFDEALSSTLISDWYTEGRGYDADPENLSIPTLTLGASSWSGSVGTWDNKSNGTITYAWELRDSGDDSVVESGSGSSPSGSGSYSGGYYLHVEATNNAGTTSADSATQSIGTFLGQFVNGGLVNSGTINGGLVA